MSDFNLEQLVKPVADRCQQLVVTMGDNTEAGNLDVAGEAARELGQIVGALAGRMYAYEHVMKDLAERDPDIRAALAELVRVTPLPGSVPSSFSH